VHTPDLTSSEDPSHLTASSPMFHPVLNYLGVGVGGEGIGPTAALGDGESGDGGWTTRKAAK